MHVRSLGIRPCSSIPFLCNIQTLPQLPLCAWPREKSSTRRTMLALTMGLLSRMKGKDASAAAVNGHAASLSNASDQLLLGKHKYSIF